MDGFLAVVYALVSMMNFTYESIDPSCEPRHISINKSNPKSSLLPRPLMAPTLLNDSHENESFLDIGSCSSSGNGADYKGKQVVVDDKNDDIGAVFCNPKSRKKISKGSNKKSSWKNSIPSQEKDLFCEFVKELSEGLLNKRDQQDLTVQDIAEAMFGKAFFDSEEPHVIGPFTQMMAQCHQIQKDLQETALSPSQSRLQTNTIADTRNHHFFLPPPPTPVSKTSHSSKSIDPRDQQHARSSRKIRRLPRYFKDFEMEKYESKTTQYP